MVERLKMIEIESNKTFVKWRLCEEEYKTTTFFTQKMHTCVLGYRIHKIPWLIAYSSNRKHNERGKVLDFV